MRALRVAVVGSGPAGVFCAETLTEDPGFEVDVDVFERLPTPFGLVRYGVAPDHQKIKSIIASLSEVFETPKVRFLGNITVGTDITVDELRSHYDAVVIAYGAPLDRRLGVPGEQLPGVIAARNFVSWYSGHPDASFDPAALTGERAAVIGVGNVALDVARMLVRTPDELRRTDVPEHVVEALDGHPVREVCVIGRRGPEHAKFTHKELLELAGVEGADIVVDPEDLRPTEERRAAVAARPATARLLSTLEKIAARPPAHRSRTVRFLFDRTPVGFLGEASLTGVSLAHTSDPSRVEVLPTELVLPAVGYRSAPLAGVPFDEASGTVPHTDSRVIAGGTAVPGLYVVGWAKRGPSGVIGTNRLCASETAAAVLADAAEREGGTGRGPDAVDDLLRSRGAVVVDWKGWLAIEATEAALGSPNGRGRVKLHDRTGLLTAAGLSV
ncbi:FAD-dependent oxidoreductase [Streptomyces sp. NBC_01239]|uniref:FAD-dependent oxidoreductase n=1 Tax=Streptomyces sp. NBC_01239 TaxID=2903792 RepID=UPI0022550455|nr:FAD-dependent oxidoreductase [Streptomyces sp. NBC_01239]MCX4816323.1 FAD-dependent oxidoreductase [Streptomyces sp. NBC_01239]